ncbi:MAG: hypothetical protein KF814_12345 [Nitrospiraceae bacterium]|nr:hypothetical protein [Nitrospiraceae bacterium]
MSHPTRLILFCCLFALFLPNLASASAGGEIGSIIENFVSRQFPDAASHFWVVNGTQWDGDEMIVDINAVIQPKQQPEPVSSRFLLLIVAGKLEGVQSVPLDGQPECKTDEA